MAIAPTASLNLLNPEDPGAMQSRIQDSTEAMNLVTKLIRADQVRNETRAKVRGLVDGNNPYSNAELRRTGQAYRTNTNFREAEAFLSQSMSAFYDVFSEVPTYATVRTAFGDDINKRIEWSKIITEEFDRLQKLDTNFDYTNQLSQREMVLIGHGPIVFESNTSWKCKAIESGSLLVPDSAKADTTTWKIAVIMDNMQVDDLWNKIKGEFTEKGWNVKMAKSAIMNAAPTNKGNGNTSYDWEYYQRRLRSNDITYSAQCSVIRIAHVFYKEFDGKITHRIINIDDGTEWLYTKIGKYGNWNQVIHPMYYDRGDGKHHGVKGLGIKMFGPLENKNRMRCAALDAAYSRAQILLKPLNASALNKTGVVQMGPYAVLPPDFDYVNIQSGGVMDAPFAALRDMEDVLQSNLSQYRQTLDKTGNPVTATQVRATVAQQSALGKTQLSRYYQQLDELFAERYRRASNPELASNDQDESVKQAKQFQKRCLDRGVPPKAMRDIDVVQASRTVGQGSQFSKQQTLGQLLALMPMLPEGGRVNLMQDYVASQAGQQMVDRYVPSNNEPPQMQDQAALAMMENSVIKDGSPVLTTDTQDNVVHLKVHIGSANEAASSLQQGGDTQKILLFLQGIAQHCGEHLQRLQGDDTRKNEAAQFTEQLKELVMVIGELQKHVQQQMQDQQVQQQAQAVQQGTDPKTQLEMARTQAEIARQDAVAAAQIRREDALANSDINRKTSKTASDVNMKTAKAASDIAIKSAKEQQKFGAV